MNLWNWFFSKTLPPAAPAPMQPVAAPSHPDDTQAAFEALMALREGRRQTVYVDTGGHLTVGIGHLVTAADMLHEGDTISEAQVDMLFRTDGASAMASAVKQATQARITDQTFLPFLASVNFQLGNAWTSKFPNTWDTICRGDYTSAANAFAGTLWEKQTPVRVADFQAALKRLPPKPVLATV